MVSIRPELGERTAASVRAVAAAALAEGGREPLCIVVEEPSRRWLELLVAMPAPSRNRAVLVAASDMGLGAAVRLGVGGALWLPPSTPAMTAAMAAAAQAAMGECTLCATDPTVLGLAGGKAVAAIFARAGFWHRQLGPARLTELLAAVAEELPPPATVTSWPALLAWGVEPASIISRWRELAADRALAPRHGLVAGEIDAGPGGFETALRQILEGLESEPGEGSGEPLGRVFELPSGRHIGWFAADTEGRPSMPWLAAPAENGEPGRWLLHGSGEPGLVLEVLSEAEVRAAEGAVAVRVPGWASAGAGPEGVPATLLVRRLAEVAASARLPLWVPNVDQRALHLVLTLRGTLWVDGPAVPDRGPR